MATAQTTATASTTSKDSTLDVTKKRALRRRTRATHRKTLAAKLKTDKEFTKAYFEGRSKRAIDKKAAFRKKKSKKK